MVDYHGFKLQRSASGMGTNITFTDWLGQMRTMLVLDAKYRTVVQFGTAGTDVPELENFDPPYNASGHTYLNTERKPVPYGEPVPEGITNAHIYSQWGEVYASDKTARENCDIWLNYRDLTDDNEIVGVPAVEWCRQQLVNGQPCDVPNMYEAMCIWPCGDILDEMDPSAATHTDLKLGYTATGQASGGYGAQGRTQYGNGKISYGIHSSTEKSDAGMKYVYSSGDTNCNVHKAQWLCAVPILEL